MRGKRVCPPTPSPGTPGEGRGEGSLHCSPHKRSSWIPLLAASLLLALSACTSPAPPPSPGYYGPTLPLPQLIDQINQNNTRIPTLWSRVRFNATLVDRPHNKSARIDGFGNLMFTAPNQMKLTAHNEFIDLFEMGSDGQNFWLYEKKDADFWWGSFADAGDLDSTDIPIRPDMVLEILGIRPVNPALDQQPVPVLRFNNVGDTYIVDWSVFRDGRWEVVKEILYDRKTLLPQRVLLFDADGRVVLCAWLSNFQPVDTGAGDSKNWPLMAARYKLYFPYGGTTMTFDLSDMSLTRNGRPNTATYRMPDPAALSQRGVRVTHIQGLLH